MLNVNVSVHEFSLQLVFLLHVCNFLACGSFFQALLSLLSNPRYKLLVWLSLFLWFFLFLSTCGCLFDVLSSLIERFVWLM